MEKYATRGRLGQQTDEQSMSERVLPATTRYKKMLTSLKRDASFSMVKINTFFFTKALKKKRLHRLLDKKVIKGDGVYGMEDEDETI